MPEQALDGIPLDLGLVVKKNLLNFHVASTKLPRPTDMLHAQQNKTQVARRR